MFRLRKALQSLGPVAVRTDCIYIAEHRAAEIPGALKAAGLEMVDKGPVFQNIGRFRLEPPKSADLLPTKMLGPRFELMAHVSGDTTDSFVKPAPAFEDLEMEDERDDDEASRLYPALVDVGGMPAAFVPHDEDTPYTDDEVNAAIRALWMPDAAARQTPSDTPLERVPDTEYRSASCCGRHGSVGNCQCLYEPATKPARRCEISGCRQELSEQALRRTPRRS